MQNIPPSRGGQSPFESKEPSEEKMSFTRIISGNLVPVDLLSLPENDQKTLQFVQKTFESLQLPPGNYALDASGQIKNLDSGKTYNVTEQAQVQETIKILSGNEKEIVIGITLKAASGIDPKISKAFENIINEHLISETSFYNSFSTIANAMKNDRQSFIQSLKAGGVTDEEIKLIFEPLLRAAEKVKAFQEGLQEIKELRDKAKTSKDYENVMNAYKKLIDTQYASYARGLHEMMLAQKYYNQFGVENKKNRIGNAIESYFKKNGVINPFGKPGLTMNDTMIGFVQRLPRHELLFKDVNEKSLKLGNDHAATLEIIRKTNFRINEDMPPSAKMGITDEVFHPELKERLQKKGWKVNDMKEFVSIYNSYNKELEELETILFLKDKNPSNYRLSSELHKLASKKQKAIQNLNKKFEKWGGVAKLGQLKEVETDLEKPLNLVGQLETRLSLVNRIYIDETHLSKSPVLDRILYSPVAKKYLHQLVDQLRSQGWTPQDIDRFNSIYVKHAQAFNQLQLAFLKAGENPDDPNFKKEAGKIIPKLRSAQREFNRFGGFAKTEKLYRVISNMRAIVEGRELKAFLLEADFHSQINRQMAFWEPLANYLKI